MFRFIAVSIQGMNSLVWTNQVQWLPHKRKEEIKQFPYSSPSMLHTACFGSWKVAYYSEGHSLPFCGNITVRPAKELKKTMKADTDPRSLSWAKMFPSLCVCPSWVFFFFFPEVKGQWHVQSLVKSKQLIILIPQGTLWEGPSRDKLHSSNIEIQRLGAGDLAQW